MAKKKKAEIAEPSKPLSGRAIAFLSVATAVVYFFSNPKPQSYYDYTFRVAANMLRGHVAFSEKQPSWLNEFVPFEGFYYSVFPLGAVLSMMPAALLKIAGIITDMPGAMIAAILAGVTCLLSLRIAAHYEVSNSRRILLSLAIPFGTFMWTNVTFTGAWQLALGFAVVGELGAIYFTVFDRRPLIAGAFFALAFGNRTEVLLTAPIFMYLLLRSDEEPKPRFQISNLRTWMPGIIMFCAVPFVLGVATLVYNYIRFHSFTDFGYARIPGVLEEPWYNHGIFSVWYIPRQAWEMLVKTWEWKAKFPNFVPDPFSSSILWSSPFLLLTLRFGARDRVLKYASWIAIVLLTLVLWMHGNSGGWQFSYRYAMVLLPWSLVILLESAKKKVSRIEWTLYGVSFAMNAYATWLFHWTEYMKPG